jgi:glyoxylase-like metal-dependent hydrolase (beta-lactamase superfamily II)
VKIHHLNCATLCPPLGRWLVHRSGTLVCHCLLIETAHGLVLVDTGMGRADLADPKRRLGRSALTSLRPRLADAETAIAQVIRLGFSSADVRHVIVTHLDLDHAGGLSDFPHAEVHVFAPEHRAAMAPATRYEKARYRTEQLGGGIHWRLHEVPAGEPWFGFECVRPVGQLPPEILLVPLVGHSRGHCGVAVADGAGWLLHCGDAYFASGEVAAEPHGPRLLRLIQRLDDSDHAARVANQARLRTLAAEQTGVRLFCAHDPDELARFAAAQTEAHYSFAVSQKSRG